MSSPDEAISPAAPGLRISYTRGTLDEADLLPSPLAQFRAWFAEAVAANWVSPSRGLLWASPIVVMSVAGTVVALRTAARGEPVVPGRALVVALWATVVAVNNRHRLHVKAEDVPGIVEELKRG